MSFKLLRCVMSATAGAALAFGLCTTPAQADEGGGFPDGNFQIVNNETGECVSAAAGMGVREHECGGSDELWHYDSKTGRLVNGRNCPAAQVIGVGLFGCSSDWSFLEKHSNVSCYQWELSDYGSIGCANGGGKYWKSKTVRGTIHMLAITDDPYDANTFTAEPA